MTDLVEVVITAPDAEWLAGFARRLVEDRLCAGAHEIERIRSVYRWDGEINDRPEARLAIHTRADLARIIIRRANEEHPYEVPCVVALPFVAANPDYAAWIEAQTIS